MELMVVMVQVVPGLKEHRDLQDQPGQDHAHEHIALNPVPRDTKITSQNLTRAFVYVPATFKAEGMYLTSIQTSMGVAVNTTNIIFTLHGIDATGSMTNIYSWHTWWWRST